MRVIICEPHKKAYVADIEPSLETYQSIVGGYIEFFYPFRDDVTIICNEEGKLKGLPLNRPVSNDSGEVIEYIAGTFFITGLGEEDIRSLTDEEANRYLERFLNPYAFIIRGRSTICLEIDDEVMEEFQKMEESQKFTERS